MSVSVEGVRFGYRRGTSTIEGLSWEVAGGRTLLLGPNGAGKSTFLSLVAGLLRPRAGRIRVGSAGSGPVGYLPQSSPRVRALTVGEQVDYAAWLAGLGPGRDRAVRSALEAVNLGGRRSVRMSRVSGGEARRVNLACAVVHDPEVLLLDEPTTGLDPLERENLAVIIGEQLAAGTVLMATHEAEALIGVSDRVAIMDGGRIVDEFGAGQGGADWLSRYRAALGRAG